MEPIVIEKTKSTPYIEFNQQENKLIIQGQSYPENAFNFYEPLTRWLDAYLNLRPTTVTIELNIPYINTSSSKCLMDILDKLEDAHAEGISVSLLWYCNEENESEIECAEEFLEDLTMEYKIISCPDHAR